MIESTNYPYLPISVRSGTFSANAVALVDTGFDGYLALPRSLSAELGVPQFAEPIGVASGDVFTAPGYVGTIQLVGFQDEIPGITRRAPTAPPWPC